MPIPLLASRHSPSFHTLNHCRPHRTPTRLIFSPSLSYTIALSIPPSLFLSQPMNKLSKSTRGFSPSWKTLALAFVGDRNEKACVHACVRVCVGVADELCEAGFRDLGSVLSQGAAHLDRVGL